MSKNSSKNSTQPTVSKEPLNPMRMALKQLKYIPGLSDLEVSACKEAKKVIDDEFRRLANPGAGGIQPDEMVDLLEPLISSPSWISRVAARDGVVDRRHVTIAQLAAMRRVFGTDINALLDELIPPRENFTDPQS